MSEIKKKIVLYHFVLLFMFFVSIITSIVMFIQNDNLSYLYTTLLNIPFMSAAKLIFLAISKEFEKKQTRDKRKTVILKMVFLHMISYIIMFIPFIITSVVFLITSNGVDLVNEVTNSKYLNLWISISFLFGTLISWIIINMVITYKANNKTVKNNDIKQQHSLETQKE